MFGKKKEEENKVPRMIIELSGKVSVEGTFPREARIDLLRKELIYQEELERFEIQQEAKKEFSKTLPKPPERG
jgi:hypothetical protein